MKIEIKTDRENKTLVKKLNFDISLWGFWRVLMLYGWYMALVKLLYFMAPY